MEHTANPAGPSEPNTSGLVVSTDRPRRLMTPPASNSNFEDGINRSSTPTNGLNSSEDSEDSVVLVGVEDLFIPSSKLLLLAGGDINLRGRSVLMTRPDVLSSDGAAGLTVCSIFDSCRSEGRSCCVRPGEPCLLLIYPPVQDGWYGHVKLFQSQI